MAPSIELWPMFLILVLAIAFGVLIGAIDARIDRDERRAPPTVLSPPRSQQNLKRSA